MIEIRDRSTGALLKVVPSCWKKHYLELGFAVCNKK